MVAPVLNWCIHFRSIVIYAAVLSPVNAQPLFGPGDPGLRHDLKLLVDTDVISVPVTSWPISVADLSAALDSANVSVIDASGQQALSRLRDRVAQAAPNGWAVPSVGLSVATESRPLRGFEDTPRADAVLQTSVRWQGQRFIANLNVAYAVDPFDGDELRPDGTYVGVRSGNWLISAGWQERWYGPGNDASLILSSNARPAPGLMMQRIRSTPFQTRWLSWAGPWTITGFMELLDDTRTVTDAWLFGLRASFRPIRNLELGFTRTAQWCGESRPCSLSTFGDLLVGNDNRGVNVTIADEPGNQLGGIDLRWSLPVNLPAAVYMQWVAEDGRGGGGAVGSWLRQLGIEYRGAIGEVSHRTHFEISDTLCRKGGFGFASGIPDCAYEHGVYQSGYRYKQQSLGHPADGDSLSYSIGSTLVQSAGHTWNASIRYMEINRAGQQTPGHTVSPFAQDRQDIQLSHTRNTRFGQLRVSLGYQRLTDRTSDRSESDTVGYLQWTSR